MIYNFNSARQKLLNWGEHWRAPSNTPIPQNGIGLEALAVHNSWARLIILTLGDPHLLECGQGGQNGSTNPHGVLALWWGNNLDLHGGRCKCGQLLGHALTNACKHGGSTGQHNIAVEILADVHIALHDGLEGGVVDATGLLTDEAWLEQDLRASEALTSDGDDVSIWKLIGLLLVRALTGLLHLSVEVKGNVAQLLLDVTDNLTLSSCGERITTLCQDLHEVLGQITSGKIQSQNGVGQCVTLV